jgi:hypothetical protein
MQIRPLAFLYIIIKKDQKKEKFNNGHTIIFFLQQYEIKTPDLGNLILLILLFFPIAIL